MPDILRAVIVPIHPEGYIFVAGFAAVSLLLGLVWAPLGWTGLLLTCWCAYFFRDPPRVTPSREGLVVSPADGVVSKIEQAVPPAELGLANSAPRTRISVFLNIFNVHINRVPVNGTIGAVHYHPGTFLNASLDKASEQNERNSAVVKTPDGKEIIFVQIAGLIARRIVSKLKEGQEVSAGERYGLIRFGSRADIYLPEGVHPLVIEGQQVTGGETVLADLQSREPARIGIKR